MQNMIRPIAAADDDPSFIALAERILGGAITALQVREVYLVRIDNWFDFKWLGWRSRWRHGELQQLRIPLFTPNRVCSEQRFLRDAESSTWNAAPIPKPLHLRQPGRPWLAQPVDRIAEHAAFIWYSGGTGSNKVGSLMLYLSGAEGYRWYASLKAGDPWTVADEVGITRGELLAFERVHQAAPAGA